jgi:hypothetical protein
MTCNEAAQRNIIRKASGREDLHDDDIEIFTNGRWDIGGHVADQFSSGRIFLAGDAAHALPPNRGGYGAYTGIADAQNIAWKLAAVVHGESTPELLETYDEERRPIADAPHDQIFAREDYRKYAENRNWPGKDVEIQDDLGMELGHYYRSKIIIDGPDGSAIVKKPDERNGQPGTRAPHVALCSKNLDISSLDYFGRSWVVITKNKACPGRIRSKDFWGGNGLFRLGDDASEKNEGDFDRLFGSQDGGASLIRPDGFIAWRSKDWLPEAKERLAKALIQVACSSKLLYSC